MNVRENPAPLVSSLDWSLLENDATLGSVLAAGAAQGEQAMVFLGRDGETVSLSYRELFAQGLALAAQLADLGLERGDPVVLFFDDEQSLVLALWAVWLRGAVPAPLSPPAGYTAKDEALAKILVVDAQCAAHGQRSPLMLSDLPFDSLARVDAFRSQVAPARFVDMTRLDSHGPALDFVPGHGDDLALLMFSSGSTGDPKGVRLSHRQILANLVQLQEASEIRRSDRSLSWLPLTHDMGLVLFHLCHTLAGITQFKMTPLAFARDPGRMLDFSCQHGITILGMPNFGYDQLLRAAKPAPTDRWQLAQVRLIYNGAEPIDPDLCRRFYDEFARFGLARGTINPGWGIAEAAVAASGFPMSWLARWHDVPSVWIKVGAGLTVGQPIRPCPPGSDGAMEIVGLGPLMARMAVRVLDDEGRALDEAHLGYIEIQGPNVTRGYFGAPDADWIATGDIGFIHQEMVFLTGRAKDVLFINGRNRFSNDIESALCRELSWPANQLAVVGVTHGQRRTEQVVVFFRADRDMDKVAQAQRLRAATESLLGYPVAGAIPLSSLPKTTSGKIRRFALRQALLAGTYDQSLPAWQAAPSRPLNEGEAALAPILLPLLGTDLSADTLDPDLPLSRYGLDSVGFMQFTFALCRHLGRQLAPQDLMRGASLAAIAALVAVAPQAPQQQEIRAAQVPLTARQQLLWTAWQLEPGSGAYNETYWLQLEGALDGARWAAAAQRAVAGQPMLHARVRAGSGSASLVSTAEAQMDIRTEQCPQADLAQRLLNLAHTAFDLERGPLARLHLVQTESSQVLFLSAHHIVTDGWSLHSLISRIFAAYDSTDDLPGESLLWQEAPRWTAAQLAARRDVLRAGEPLQLPSEAAPDAALPVAQVTRLLSPAASHALRAWQLDKGSEFGALSAALLVLLGRLCSCSQPLLATVTSGRFDAAAHQRIGYFARTMPLTAHLDPELDFTKLVASLEPQRLAMLAGELPDLAELELAGADLARALRVVYVHQNLPTIRLPEGLRVVAHVQHRNAPRADLCISSTWRDPGLELVWEYDTRRLGQAQVAAYAELFDYALGRLLAQPEQRIGQLDLLSPGQRQAWRPYRQLDASLAAAPDVLTCIEAQARLQPALPALSDQHEKLSYGQLQERIDALCVGLEQLGLARGERLALLTERSSDYIVGLLACLKMAAIAIPLDPALPAERIALILAESAAGVLLTSSGMDLAPELTAGRRVLAFTGAGLAGGQHHMGRPRGAEDGAYLIFTSGSTGKPKGVLVPHGGLNNLVAWVVADFGYQAGETICQFAPFSFDVSMAEILPSLSAGLHVHVLPSERRASPALYLASLQEQQAQIATVTPAYLAVLNESPAACRESLASLRLMILGGEALMSEEVRRFRAHSPQVTVVNVYGPTETTVLSSAYRVPQQLHAQRVWQPLGRPIRQTELWLLDEAGRVCPSTVTGTIHIGGAGLALGYWQDKDKTDGAFQLRDPDGRGPRRFYCTGDLARLASDGELEFVGRADTQIKLRGFRIELGEIESVLARHPDVEQAVVCALARDGGERSLVAYFSGRAAARDSLAEFLRQHLPAYMLPSLYIHVPVWPLSDNRKVDRARLPKPQWGGTAPTGEVLLTTATEQALAEIWCQLLGVAQVSREDNFALLGGSSLAAAQLVNRIRDRFGRELPLAQAMRAANLAQMAQALDAADQYTTPEPLRGAPATDQPEAVSEAQARMVFLEHTYPDTALNTIPLTLAVAGAIDGQRLKTAVAQLARRHWILRVGLQAGDAGVTQVDSAGTPAVQVSEHEQDADALAALAAFQGAAFKLMPGPLWRVALVKAKASGRNWLALNLHHAIADGVTLVRVLSELDALYRGQSLPATEGEFSYPDYVRWQAELFQSPWGDAARAFWADPARRCPLPRLPKLPGGDGQVGGRQFTVDLNADQTAGLQSLCQEHQVSPFQLMLAIFGFVLGQRCDSRRFAVGVTLSGRSRQAWETVPGLFVNTVPLAFEWAEQQSFVDLLARLGEQLGELQDWQDFPLNRVMAAQKRRDMPFDVLFNEEILPPDLHFAGAAASLEGISSGIAKMPLVVSFLLGGKAWRWRVEQRHHTCAPSWLAGLMDEIKHLINILPGMGRARLADLQAADEDLMNLLDIQ